MIQVLLGEEEVSFVQAPVNADGACVSARFNKVSLFAHGCRSEAPAISSSRARVLDCPAALLVTRLPGEGRPVAAQEALFLDEGFRLQSRHSNLVAFHVDLPLLLRTLRGATSNAADHVEVRLIQRPVVVLETGHGKQGVGANRVQVNKPFLSFTARVRGWRSGRTVVGRSGGRRANT